MEFSDQANIYLKYRPKCPRNLMDFIVSNCTHKDYAWDCGTGNGQVASELSANFKKILATDISPYQLEHAIKRPNINYQLGSVEEVNLEPSSLDLITVSQAFHWFDHGKFMSLCSEYLVQNGVLAIWSYEPMPNKHPIIEYIKEFNKEQLTPYWNDKTKKIHNNPFSTYKGFKQIIPEQFNFEKHFNSEDLVGYVSTWSATNKYVKEHQVQFDQFCDNIRSKMQDDTVLCKWNINLRIGVKI